MKDLSPGEQVSLAGRIRHRDSMAEEELVRHYQQPVLLLARMRTGNSEDARDLAQEILMAVLEALRADKVREPDRLTVFIHGTARNLINSYLRPIEGRVHEQVSDLLDAQPCEQDAEKLDIVSPRIDSPRSPGSQNPAVHAAGRTQAGGNRLAGRAGAGSSPPAEVEGGEKNDRAAQINVTKDCAAATI